jgi:hypothetical protein
MSDGRVLRFFFLFTQTLKHPDTSSSLPRIGTPDTGH